MKIKAKIHANSKEFKIKEKNNILHIYLTQPPQKNKANIELIKELSGVYGSCKIIKGKTSKTKVLEISEKI